MKKTSIIALLLVCLLITGCSKQDQSKDATNNSGDTLAEKTYTADSWKEIIPESCKVFNDGCNTCQRLESDSTQAACTRMYCETYNMPYCMDQDGSTGSNTDNDNVNGVNYVGMTVEDAQALAEKNDTPFRIIEVDGVSQPVTADYILGRVSAISQSGVITSFTVEE